MASNAPIAPTLQLLDTEQGHGFVVPTKRINDGNDVAFFLSSKAYADIMTFIFQLNTSMLPRRHRVDGQDTYTDTVQAWRLHDPNVSHSPAVQGLGKLLDTLATIIDEAPPDPGPRRFGNVSFKVWYDIVRSRIVDLLDQHVPRHVLAIKSTFQVCAHAELEAYLMGSFGSPQRLDYGTGHELSFLAFLACLWKLGAFPASEDGDQERSIVLGVIEPYLVLVRRLIVTYTLEPAGSHGVWGLDDHSFAPYIFGSAQLSPPIATPADMVTEGSLANAPNPAHVAHLEAVKIERGRNMYFSAIGFIYDVKKGPFWEHSPILYDISGVKAGWAKINKGMMKMYNAEVLSKFPVVQHFPFGSLFLWEKDPDAKAIQASVHTSSQPKFVMSSSTAPTARPQNSLRDPLVVSASRVPSGTPATTTASWATSRSAPGPSNVSQTLRAPLTSNTSVPTMPGEPYLSSKAPWAPDTPALLPLEGHTMASRAQGKSGLDTNVIEGRTKRV